MRVLVAMSGGVDSSVAAARLQEQGHDVIGVTLHLWDYPEASSGRGRCCAPEDVHDARRVADRLGFAHYAFDRRELFEEEVVSPFVEEYLSGTTPSPCVRCNRGVKIKELFKLADRLGAEKVATGHYANVELEGGVPRLHRGRDISKDQSYFLHMLAPEILARLVFPLGRAKKAEVRAEALALGLPGAGKGDSQELCFVASGHYSSFVAERAGDRLRPGLLVDEAGQELGKHEGVHAFTLGQRRNLGVALGRPAYVVALEADTGLVRLGGRDALEATYAEVESPALADDFELPSRAEVAVRYSPHTTPCRVEAAGSGKLHVWFDSPVRAVVPGQYAVFYRGSRVLGGGVIGRALRSRARLEEARP